MHPLRIRLGFGFSYNGLIQLGEVFSCDDSYKSKDQNIIKGKVNLVVGLMLDELLCDPIIVKFSILGVIITFGTIFNYI